MPRDARTVAKYVIAGLAIAALIVSLRLSTSRRD